MRITTRRELRGHGHSIYGQSLVEGGIVIAMSTLAAARNLPGARVLARVAVPAAAHADSRGGEARRLRSDPLRRERCAGRPHAESESPPVRGESCPRRHVYPFSAVKLSRTEWRQHYGDDFGLLAAAKRRFDSQNVLASGPDMFCGSLLPASAGGAQCMRACAPSIRPSW